MKHRACSLPATAELFIRNGSAGQCRFSSPVFRLSLAKHSP